MWKPKEIIVNESVIDDPTTKYFISQCPGIPVHQVDIGNPKTIVPASKILSQASKKMLDKIIAGKQVVYLSPATTAVDTFEMDDDRLLCPHFDRLKLASNGCFYQCDWCYLKLTYRANFPYITVKVQYDNIKKQLEGWLKKANHPVIFNSGELADSLSMEHLTGAGKEFIPWFGKSEKGRLFMLTKSDNVDGILNLDHNGHTIIAWSMNNAEVSRKYEIGAPSFERRLNAAAKVQKAGYPVRMRLDPIVPYDGWKDDYAETVKQIFEKVSPERMTIGTLRFEKGFYDNRKHIFNTGPKLPAILDKMEPMFEPKIFGENKKPKIGKYSFSDDQRIEIFRHVINEIRKYSDCKIALCKESSEVWKASGLDASKCSCACQLDYADMSNNQGNSSMTEQIKSEEKNPIDFIPGSTNILLIAPHGHPKDDENTGKLVRVLAEQNGCYAIINEYYRKPVDSKNDKTADKENKRVNLNRKGQVGTHLKTEFLDPLIKYKNEIIERFGNVLLIWIHGAYDDSVPESIKVEVGYGQDKTDTRHTAKIDTIDALIKGLNENNLTAIKADITENKFCARDIHNMNQYFRDIEGKNFDTLQSFQLEFRWTGCRDTDESIETTARNLAYAISALVQPAVENNQSPDKAQVPERISDPEEVKGAIEVGGHVDHPLVETAYQKLSQVFSKNYEQALMEAGQYLVRIFYGGEEGIEDLAYDKDLVLSQETIENARNNQSPKKISLNKLIEKIEGDKTSSTPSRSWIINAVNLIVQDYDIKKELKPLVHTYKQLLLSHKVALLKLKDLTKKQELIEEEAKNPSTVKDFIQKVQKLMPPSPDKPLSLPSLLKKPDELMKEENAEKLSLEALKSTQARTLEKLKTITDSQHKNIETEIENLKQDLENRQQCFDRYAEVKGNIEKALQHKQKPKKKSKGPNIISVSRRTDIPACYSDWFFTRLKEGFVQSRKDAKSKPKEVSLKPEDVRCFVFWTKNPGPMMDRLDELNGYHFYFHFTLTPYGQDIEGAVLPPKDELTQTFIQLSKKIGKNRVIWRYDPILLTDKIDIDYHKAEFTKLAESLQGYTDKCIISFIDTGYLSAEAKEQLKLKTITKELMREIGKEFHPIAEKHGIKIGTCSEKIDLTDFNIAPGKCVDDKLIGTLIGKKLSLKKDQSQRKACKCVVSVDIGTDNTCKNGCQYCYATKDHKQARLNYHRHDKTSPVLIGEMPEDNKKEATEAGMDV